MKQNYTHILVVWALDRKYGRKHTGIFIQIVWAITHNHTKYLQDWRFTDLHTFLFLLLLQLFFIRCLSYQRNSFHLFLKFLQFALVDLDTNTQGRGNRTWTTVHQPQRQGSICTTFQLKINSTVLELLHIFHFEIPSQYQSFITALKTSTEDFGYCSKWCMNTCRCFFTFA